MKIFFLIPFKFCESDLIQRQNSRMTWLSLESLGTWTDCCCNLKGQSGKIVLNQVQICTVKPAALKINVHEGERHCEKWSWNSETVSPSYKSKSIKDCAVYTLIRAAIYRDVVVLLGSLYDFQATNRKEGRFSSRSDRGERPHEGGSARRGWSLIKGQ